MVADASDFTIGSGGNERTKGLDALGRFRDNVDVPHATQTSNPVDLSSIGFLALQCALQIVTLAFTNPEAILHGGQLLSVATFSARADFRCPIPRTSAIGEKRPN